MKPPRPCPKCETWYGRWTWVEKPVREMTCGRCGETWIEIDPRERRKR